MGSAVFPAALREGRWLRNSWLPLFLLVLVCGASWFFREFYQELTLAPLLSLLSLFLLASRYPPLFVFCWLWPFVLVSYILINPYSQFAWIRTGTLILGGWITCYVAFLRIRTERLLGSHQLVFSTLPYPILVSDPTSKVVFFNRAASNLLKIPEHELLGFSWFNLLLDQGNRAEEMERYVRWSLSKENEGVLKFDLCGLDGQIWKANVVKDATGKKGRLITTFSKTGHD